MKLSTYIKESLENPEYCLSTLKQAYLLGVNSYCGSGFECYEVLIDNIKHRLYVLCERNDCVNNFLNSISAFSFINGVSCFVNIGYYRQELLVFDDKSGAEALDIAVIKLVEGVKIENMMLENDILYKYDVLRILKNIINAFVYLDNNKLITKDINSSNTYVNSDMSISIVPDIYFTLRHAESNVDIEGINRCNIIWFLNICFEMLGIPVIDKLNVDDVNDKLNTSLNVDCCLNIKETLESILFSMSKLIDNGFIRENLGNKLPEDLYSIESKRVENRYIVQNKSTMKYGIIDIYGEVVCDFKYDNISIPEEGVSIGEIEDKYTAVNSVTGENLFDNIGDNIFENLEWDVNNNIFIAKKGDLFSVISRNGEELTSDQYCWIGEFSCGMAVVQSVANLKYGYINNQGKVIIKPIFENALSFSNDIAYVYLNNSWRSVTKDGEFI